MIDQSRRFVLGLVALTVAAQAQACSVRGDVLTSESDVSLGGDGGSGGAGGDTGGGGIINLKADELSVGSYHTCIVQDARLYCWGDGERGALGLGDNLDRTTPVRVGDDSDWLSVTAGEGHSCGLRTGGSVWCWGLNEDGQVGSGDFAPVDVPTFVSTTAPVVRLAGNQSHNVTILADGTLWGWGLNEEGQLAQGEPFSGMGINRNSPVQMEGDNDWIFADGGQGHSCGIRADGSLWCTGRNSGGELGLGDGAAGQIRQLARVGTGTDWLTVRGGQNHTCALRVPGMLWCFGENEFGQLGVPDVGPQLSPKQIGDADDWVDLSLDTFHTCGIREGGTLWCWGRNVEGQLGTGDFVDTSEPRQIGTDTDWESVIAGRFHTCGIKTDRRVLCTGQNSSGQLGVGDTETRPSFTQVQSL